MSIPPATWSPPAGYEVSTDRSRLDIDRIYRWLADSYWAGDRDRRTVERSIANSIPFGVYAPSGEQVAFTRAISDLATFCWLGDVIVAPEHRGRGIGSWLVRTVVEDQRSLGVPRFVLATRDAHGVYDRVGFTALSAPRIWMELDLRSNRARPDEAIEPTADQAVDRQSAPRTGSRAGRR